MQPTQTENSSGLQFRYALVYRPANFATIPRGLEYSVEPRPARGQAHHEMARHGILVVQRALTREELISFEIAPLVDMPALGALAERIASGALTEYAADYIQTHDEDPALFVRGIADRAQHLERGVAYSICDLAALATLVLEVLKRAAAVADAV
jgi:hypothetical protein